MWVRVSEADVACIASGWHPVASSQASERQRWVRDRTDGQTDGKTETE